MSEFKHILPETRASVRERDVHESCKDDLRIAVLSEEQFKRYLQSKGLAERSAITDLLTAEWLILR